MRKFWIIVAVALGMGGAGDAAAQEAPKELTCWAAALPPFVIPGSKAITGINSDVLVDVGRRTGIHIYFQILPRAELEAEIVKPDQDKIDCAFAFPKQAAYEAVANFTHVPLHVNALNLFMKPDLAVGFKSLANLKGRTLGVPRGMPLPPSIARQSEAGAFKLVEIEPDATAFRQVVNNQLDALLLNREEAAYQLRSFHAGGITQVDPPVSRSEVFVIFPKKRVPEVVIPMFDDALRQQLKDGTVKTILNKYN